MSSTRLSAISEESDVETHEYLSRLASEARAEETEEPASPTTPKTPSTPGSKDKKTKRIFSALKKHSSEFIGSFKRHESQVERRRSTSSEACRWLNIPAGTVEERRRQFQIDKFLEMMDRGPYWWERITRAEQRKLAYEDSDSIETLVHALERAEGGWRDEEEKDLYFRCDIHTNNRAKFAKIEKECKQLLIAAGGKLLDEIEDIGGFLYSLPNNNSTMDPLANSDETLYTGHIALRFWTPISPAANKNDPEVDEPGILGASPKNGDNWPLTPSPAAKSKMRAWIAEQRIKAEQAAAEAERVRQELEDDEVVLSPRILDAGVELAILDPGRLMMSGSEMRLGLPRESSVMEVASQDEEVAVLRDAETAVRARPRLVNVTRTFGQEMRQVEGLYRDWVPSMSRGRGI